MNGTNDAKTPINANFLPYALKAPIAERRVLRPSVISSSSKETPKVKAKMKYVKMNVPPPNLAAKYGKRHKLPKPTAEAAAAKINAVLFDHVERFSFELELAQTYFLPIFPA